MAIDKGWKLEISFHLSAQRLLFPQFVNYIDITSLECRVLSFLLHFQILVLLQKTLSFSQQTTFMFLKISKEMLIHFVFQTEKKKHFETKLLQKANICFYCFFGGAGDDGLVTVLKIVQGNKIVEQNSSIFSISSGFFPDTAGQMKDIRKFFQASQATLGTINQNQGLLCNTGVCK